MMNQKTRQQVAKNDCEENSRLLVHKTHHK